MLRSVIIIGTIISGTAALAEPASMRGQAIKELVPGSVIHIDTPLGSTLPVRFTDDGLMSGEAGGLASYLGSATDRGKWWVENDKLCQKWFKWFDAEIKCLQLRQQGQRIFWNSDDGKTGTATIAMRTPPVAAPPLAPAYAMSLRAPQSVSAEPAEASVAERPITAPKPQAVKPIAIAPKAVKPAVINQAPPEKQVAALPLSEAASKKEKSNSARAIESRKLASAIDACEPCVQSGGCRRRRCSEYSQRAIIRASACRCDPGRWSGRKDGRLLSVRMVPDRVSRRQRLGEPYLPHRGRQTARLGLAGREP
jgi:hypothetical protein